MKYLKKFDNNSSYEEYILGEDFITPNVSYIVEDSGVYYNSFQSSNNDSYNNWVKTTYNVTDTSTAQKLGDFNIADVAEMAILENDGSGATEPVKITPSSTYQFSTIGIHTVYIKFADKTGIPTNAFFRCTELKEVIIPNTVTKIGMDAFSECSGLTSIIIPDSVTEIGISAFYYCTGLTEVTIGSGVHTIEADAFSQCKALKMLTIGSGVQTIGNNAFALCEKLITIISFATTAPSIQEYTFYDVYRRGILYVPEEAIGYDTWMSTSNYYLGKYNWTMQTISE